jgi:hypothetical protein
MTEGPFCEQITAAVGDLPQLGNRGVDVERFPAGVAACGGGDPGAGDAVRVRLAAGDGHACTAPLIEQVF